MKINYKTLGLVSISIFSSAIFCSCNDQLSTEDAQKVPSETILTNTVGLNMVLNSVYNNLLLGDSGSGSQNDACYAGMSGYAMHYDLGGSDIISTTNYGGSPESTYKFLSERTTASGDSDRIWRNMYKVINQINQILDSIDKATGSDDEKSAIKGQALAIRGICYFHLILNYQQTYSIAKEKRGVILRQSTTDDANLGFSTVQQCYTQIIQDLTSAKSTLSNYSREEKWRVNTDVISGTLARVYQVMGNWENALLEAKNAYSKYNVLMSKEEWYSGFDKLMANGCKELIWGVKYTNTSNISSNTQFNYWYNQDPSYGEAMYDGPVYNFINLLVDQKYVDLFDATDYRGTRCDKTENVTDSDQKNVMFWHRTANGDREIRARWAYNKLKTYGDGNGAKQSHSYDIDFPLMRGSEMLLIMAEANAQLNKLGEALENLHTLQQAREAKLTQGGDKTALLNAIYIERRKELLGEGVTGIYDLLRLQQPLIRYAATPTNPAGHYPWGLAQLDGYNGSDTQPTATLQSNDYRFIMQIPQLEIANNEAVTSADQNPFSGQ